MERPGISIHAPRVGCDRGHPGEAERHQISIHAPRVGCDLSDRPTIGGVLLISIHAPRVGCDANLRCWESLRKIFQSTHPVWGATTCGEGNGSDTLISIHAPRVGCDWAPPPAAMPTQNFNPRTPCGVRHIRITSTVNKKYFNPRTPCGVRRLRASGATAPTVNFNPRTPCGVRRGDDLYESTMDGFQSTHPVWGATANLYKVRGESLCSLHRLHSINSKCYNCGGEKISATYINWKNACANLPGML